MTMHHTIILKYCSTYCKILGGMKILIIPTKPDGILIYFLI